MFILIAILGWGVGSFFSKLSNTAMHPLMVASVSRSDSRMPTALAVGGMRQ
jgi:hypothetical protein